MCKKGLDQNSICKEIQEQRPITIQFSNDDFTTVDYILKTQLNARHGFSHLYGNVLIKEDKIIF